MSHSPPRVPIVCSLYKTEWFVGMSSLFDIVVDTDDTAAKILEVLNRERSGRVTFMPLNRLKPKNSEYPSGKDAIPM